MSSLRRLAHLGGISFIALTKHGANNYTPICVNSTGIRQTGETSRFLQKLLLRLTFIFLNSIWVSPLFLFLIFFVISWVHHDVPVRYSYHLWSDPLIKDLARIAISIGFLYIAISVAFVLKTDGLMASFILSCVIWHILVWQLPR